MSKKFLIAESNNNISILRKLIPSQYSNNVKFVAGKGYSAATSLASSLLYDMNNLSPDDLKKLRSNQTVQAIINAVQQEVVHT